MDYHPSKFYRIASSDTLAGPTIARTLGDHPMWFLFTGGTASMVYHLTGENFGIALEAKGLSLTELLVIEDIEFEVDPDTGEQSHHLDPPVGALVMEGTDIGIIGRRASRFGNDEIEVFFGDADPEARRPGARMAFKGWRIVKRDGTEKHELFTMRPGDTEADS